MTPEQFCYWLQGRLELREEPFSEKEMQSIREHLETVFNKVTPQGPGQIDKALPAPNILPTPFKPLYPNFPGKSPNPLDPKWPGYVPHVNPLDPGWPYSDKAYGPGYYKPEIIC